MKQLLFSLVVALAATVTVRAADLTADQIAKAQQLYTTGCLKCHPKHGGVIAPKAYTDAKWGKWLNDMMRTGKVTGDDAKLLTEYFAAVRLGKAEMPKSTAPAGKSKKHGKHDDDDKK